MARANCPVYDNKRANWWNREDPTRRDHGEMMAWGRIASCNGRCCRKENHEGLHKCRCGVEWGEYKLEV
jgi:hypothetical protein